MFPRDDFVQLAWSEFQNPENQITLSNVLAKACEMPKSVALLQFENVKED